MSDSPAPATIIGGVVSPYVRKVLAVCAIKGVPFRLDPIIPFYGDDRFTAISPLRRIPVFIDDQVTLSDSTVICQYLEDRYPTPSILPPAVAARAQARWLEEFADTRIGDVFIWGVFNEAVIKPGVWGHKRDLAAVERAVTTDLPPVLDYLESLAPGDGFVCGGLSIGDIAVAVMFRNLDWSRAAPDPARWPRTLAWVARTLATPALSGLTALADRLVRMTPAQQRIACAEAGIAVTEETMAGPAPRRGPMTT